MSRAQFVVVCFAVVAGGFPVPADAARRPAVQPVPSLTPVATQQLWNELTQRPRRLHSLTAAMCTPLRAVFYAPTDWLRLSTKLAATPSPCAQYYVSVPPLAADKTQLRADQAWRIRALGPAFHAMAEINVTGWTSWVAATGSSWREAGIEARRRMAAAGYDVSAGDTWALNELSSAVRQGTGNARANMRAFLRGLHDGDGVLPAARGTVFVVGIAQPTSDLSLYQARLQDWYEDAGFWNDLSRYAADWSQELYGDVRTYAVAGASPEARRDALNEYFQHQTSLAAVSPVSADAARTVLAAFHSPLANAAWQYDAAFGWTNVSAELMQDYVSAQVYAMRAAGNSRFGFPWSPKNLSGMPTADFNAQTDALLGRLAAAIADSAAAPEAACGAAWCRGVLDGAALTAAWRTFGSWKPSELAFTTAEQTIPPGAASSPVTIELRTSAGAAYTAGLPVAVQVTASSPTAELAAAPGGPWSSALATEIASGASATSVYVRDSISGSFALVAAAAGKTGAAQTVTVSAPPDTTPPETTIDAAPAATTNAPSATLVFSASEAGSRFECSLDRAVFSSCTSPASYGGLADGGHVFEVRAIDIAGNVDASPASASWTVATPPPPPPSGGGGGSGGAGPDLVVNASVTPTAPAVGATLTYVIAVRNLGSPASRAFLTVQLPAQVAHTGSGSDRGPGCTGTTTLVCDLDFLAGDLVATVRIDAVVSEPGTLTLTATASSQPGDVQPVNDTANVVTTVAVPAVPLPPVSRPPTLAVLGKPVVRRGRTIVDVSVRFSVAAATRLQARVTPLRTTRGLVLLRGTSLAGLVSTAARTVALASVARPGTYLLRARLRPAQLVRGRVVVLRLTSASSAGRRTVTLRIRA